MGGFFQFKLELREHRGSQTTTPDVYHSVLPWPSSQYVGGAFLLGKLWRSSE